MSSKGIKTSSILNRSNQAEEKSFGRIRNGSKDRFLLFSSEGGRENGREYSKGCCEGTRGKRRRVLTRRNKAEPVVRRGFASASFSPLRSLLPTTNRINRITIFVNYLFQNPRYSRRSVAGVTKKVCACSVRVEKLRDGDGNRKDASRDSSGSRCTPIRPLPLLRLLDDRGKKKYPLLALN